MVRGPHAMRPDRRAQALAHDPLADGYEPCCFSANSTVVSNGKTKLMKDLEEHDAVEVLSSTGEVQQSTVLCFLHRKLNTRATFLRMTTSGGQSLCMTPDHYVGMAENLTGHFVPAADICVGMQLLTPDASKKEVVVSIEKFEDDGIFAPLTSTGTIIVDGVACSCFAHIPHHAGMQLTAPVRGWLQHATKKQAKKCTAGFSVCSTLGAWSALKRLGVLQVLQPGERKSPKAESESKP